MEKSFTISYLAVTPSIEPVVLSFVILQQDSAPVLSRVTHPVSARCSDSASVAEVMSEPRSCISQSSC